MNDLISRQEAIDLFPNDALEWDTNGGYIAPHFARRMIKELPSADAEPVRHGEWLCSDDFYENGICSECEYDSFEPVDYVRDEWKYCPICGAKMDAERKEE